MKFCAACRRPSLLFFVLFAAPLGFVRRAAAPACYFLFCLPFPWVIAAQAPHHSSFLVLFAAPLGSGGPCAAP